MDLPHGHLSWSGLNLWEQDPVEYALRYIMHQPARLNSGILFGKYVAESLEAERPPDTAMRALRTVLPAYDVPEKHLEATWKGIRLVGRLDTFRRRDHAFREYKSGRRDRNGKPPWTAQKAREHGQMAFYAFMLWLLDRKLPPPAHLDWIETRETNGIVHLTSHIESFEVPITIDMILKMGARIEKAARGINKQYDKYLAICQPKNQQRSSQRR